MANWTFTSTLYNVAADGTLSAGTSLSSGKSLAGVLAVTSGTPISGKIASATFTLTFTSSKAAVANSLKYVQALQASQFGATPTLNIYPAITAGANSYTFTYTGEQLRQLGVCSTQPLTAGTASLLTLTSSAGCSLSGVTLAGSVTVLPEYLDPDDVNSGADTNLTCSAGQHTLIFSTPPPPIAKFDTNITVVVDAVAGTKREVFANCVLQVALLDTSFGVLSGAVTGLFLYNSVISNSFSVTLVDGRKKFTFQVKSSSAVPEGKQVFIRLRVTDAGAVTGIPDAVSAVITLDQTTGCTYTISPTSVSLTKDAGTGSITVTATGGCDWRAASNISWLGITAGASGTGNGTVTYSYSANTTGSERAGTISVAGKVFPVSQAGTCSYTIDHATLAPAAAGGADTVTVTTAAGCSWVSVSSSDWIVVAETTATVGSGSVHLTVLANDTTATRVGVVTIAGQTYTVTQAGATNIAILLQVTTQPNQTVVMGASLGTPVVKVIRRDSTVDSTSTAVITLEAEDTNNLVVAGVLTGTVAVAAVAGVASFPGLSIIQSGSYFLKATSPNLTLTRSNQITVGSNHPLPFEFSGRRQSIFTDGTVVKKTTGISNPVITDPTAAEKESLDSDLSATGIVIDGFRFVFPYIFSLTKLLLKGYFSVAPTTQVLRVYKSLDTTTGSDGVFTEITSIALTANQNAYILPVSFTIPVKMRGLWVTVDKLITTITVTTSHIQIIGLYEDAPVTFLDLSSNTEIYSEETGSIPSPAVPLGGAQTVYRNLGLQNNSLVSQIVKLEISPARYGGETLLDANHLLLQKLDGTAFTATNTLAPGEILPFRVKYTITATENDKSGLHLGRLKVSQGV